MSVCNGAGCLSIILTGRKHCAVRRNPLAALPGIKQPAELWGSRDAKRRDTWPAVNKEHPLRTTQPPADAHKPSCSRDTFRATERSAQRCNVIFGGGGPPPSDNTCAQTDVYIPAQHTQTRIVMPSSLDTQMNKQTRQQINKRQINIMAETETADHTVALLLFLPFPM